MKWYSVEVVCEILLSGSVRVGGNSLRIVFSTDDMTGLTIRGPHIYQRKAGPFSHTHSQDSSGVHFSSQKLTTFLVVVTFKPTLNVQTSNSMGKIWQLIGGGAAGTLPWYNRHNG